MTRLPNRRKLLLAGGGVAVTTWLGSSVAAFARDLLKLTYGETEGPHWMVPYVASARQTWKDAGLDVTTVVFPTGRVGLEAMFGGRLDCCIATDTPFVYAALRGLKPRIVACYSATTRASAIAVRANRIKGPEDFKGKTVATLVGGGGHYFLTRYLDYHHVPIRDVKVINMQPNSMVLALDRGDVDALAWDTPTAHRAVSQGDGKVVRLATPDSEKYFRQYCLMLATDAFVRSHPETCDAIVVALQKAIEFIHAHPEAAVKIAAAREKVSLAEAHESLLEFTHEILFDKRMIEEFVKQADFAIANNLATRPATDLPTLFRSLLYLEGARKAVPGSIRL